MSSNSQLLLYQNADGTIKIDVHLEDETVWLTIEQMATLFRKGKSTINEHILNIYKEGELEQNSSMRKIGISDFSTNEKSGLEYEKYRDTQKSIEKEQSLKEIEEDIKRLQK
ncbi:hypothetical protein [Algoriphagus sp. Y33]|uniref:hypothetical protein n=1 Tax=Algoriphagus sp. Y33 TaxID=2772483 RepID=UPI00177B8F45|nr:hypothetical protein [Algoriphagus sp. Y33]